MAVINRIAEYFDEMKAWRQHLHTIPELKFELYETAAYVAERLREIGVDELHEGIATTGMVALIHGKKPGPVIGLRADMDALPIQEVRDLAYKSKNPGNMHACGHDGHTTILLGAAKYLAETRNFSGSVALIFQPAEESGGGGEVMCDAGIMDRFNIKQVYGLHNWPNYPVGFFGMREGPILAAADEFTLTITGRGGHAAMPNESVDPVIIAVQIAQAFQTIISRNLDPVETAVLTITTINAGNAFNVIPEQAVMGGTVRTMTKHVQTMIFERMGQIATQMAAAMGGSAVLEIEIGYPTTVNHGEQTRFAANIAREISGDTLVDEDVPPTMGAEDFSYMLEHRPGAYVYLGNGNSAGLHHPEYDYNDEASPYGASYFVKLVETAQPA